jgi:hypothetical protein
VTQIYGESGGVGQHCEPSVAISKTTQRFAKGLVETTFAGSHAIEGNAESTPECRISWLDEAFLRA